MSFGPEEFANLYFPHSARRVPVYATLLKHPNWGATVKEINWELDFETDKETIDGTRRVLREIEDCIEICLSKNPRGPPTKVYKPGNLLNSYRDPILTHTFGKGRKEYADLKADMALGCINNPMECPDRNCRICSKSGIKTCWD